MWIQEKVKIGIGLFSLILIFGCATSEDVRIVDGEIHRLRSELSTIKAENESLRRQYSELGAVKAENEFLKAQFKAFQEESRQNLMAFRSATVKDYGWPIERLSKDLERIQGEIDGIRAEMSIRKSIQSQPVGVLKSESKKEKSVSSPETQSGLAGGKGTLGLIAQAEFIGTSDAFKYVGQKKTVCGGVASAMFAARSKGQPTFLNLDQPYPNHTFTIVIWGSDRSKFKNPPEGFFKGKRICVTGNIETYQGKPQIIVRDPSQIVIKTD